MPVFRLFLVAGWLALAVYTGIVIAHHGLDLLPVFFGDMAAMGWPGQFNADFMAMLALSGLWLAWRHGFSPLGLVFGVLGFFGGAIMLYVYLLVVSVLARGDMAVILLGPERARG